jgi:FkbM family methyltransferase
LKNLRLELSYLSSVISSKIPEGRFKERLRALFWHKFDLLEKVRNIISSVSLEPDGMLKCVLKDGSVIYGLPSENRWTRLDYMDDAGEMALFKDYGSMLSQLCEIYVEQVYEKYYMPKEGDVVLDVGANMGIFTVKVAKAMKQTGFVIAIEPDVRNIDCLKKNIEANKLSNVAILPMGVWSSKDTLKLNLFSGGTGVSSFYNGHYANLGDKLSYQEVKVDTLDNIVKGLELSHVDFVKMDIEGAEIEAVEGISELSKYNGLKMAIAAYHIVDGKVTCKRVMEKLKSLGFEVVREGAMLYSRRP